MCVCTCRLYTTNTCHGYSSGAKLPLFPPLEEHLCDDTKKKIRKDMWVHSDGRFSMRECGSELLRTHFRIYWNG